MRSCTFVRKICQWPDVSRRRLLIVYRRMQPGLQLGFHRTSPVAKQLSGFNENERLSSTGAALSGKCRVSLRHPELVHRPFFQKGHSDMLTQLRCPDIPD